MRQIRLYPRAISLLFLGLAALASQAAKAATTYTAYAGAETIDQSVQANGFFPNELWVLEGDSIAWTFVPQNEVHTVTFLAQPPGGAEQVRPSAPPPAGPPFVVQGVDCSDAAASSFDGSACASTQAGLTAPSTFTVTFPKAGNYKLVCLIHANMNGTVHVLANNKTNTALLHPQQYYDQQAEQQSGAILAENEKLQYAVLQQQPPATTTTHTVVAGIGKIVATGGGTQYGAVMRFLSGIITIHQGESVTWTNLDPTEPHTVTFGTEPDTFIPPIPAGLTAPAADGSLTATLKCSPAPAKSCDADFGPTSNPSQASNPADFLNSGFLVAQAPDVTGNPQLPAGTTRITITFNQPGNFFYHCALHDVDGMLGEVIVLPTGASN